MASLKQVRTSSGRKYWSMWTPTATFVCPQCGNRLRLGLAMKVRHVVPYQLIDGKIVEMGIRQSNRATVAGMMTDTPVTVSTKTKKKRKGTK